MTEVDRKAALLGYPTVSAEGAGRTLETELCLLDLGGERATGGTITTCHSTLGTWGATAGSDQERGTPKGAGTWGSLKVMERQKTFSWPTEWSEPQGWEGPVVAWWPV